MITVLFEPEGEQKTFPRLNTALQLLQKLGIKPTDALLIRGDELLTPDRRLHPGDHITIRFVASRG